MTMASPCLISDQSITNKRSVIEQTYPGWHIRQWPGGMWSATRVTPPTEEQAAAGLHHCLLQPGLDALAAVLCQQLLIAQTAGRP